MTDDLLNDDVPRDKLVPGALYIEVLPERVSSMKVIVEVPESLAPPAISDEQFKRGVRYDWAKDPQFRNWINAKADDFRKDVKRYFQLSTEPNVQYTVDKWRNGAPIRMALEHWAPLAKKTTIERA